MWFWHSVCDLNNHAYDFHTHARYLNTCACEFDTLRVKLHIKFRSTGTRIVLSFLFFFVVVFFLFSLGCTLHGLYSLYRTTLDSTMMRVKSTRKVFFYFHTHWDKPTESTRKFLLCITNTLWIKISAITE
jgi:hypothetical protein